jgi:hypothetical protein
LYCDGDTERRRAARTVLDILFHRLTTWLAPILVFTMEEVWLERFPGEDSSVHLQDIPETPAAWRDEALAAKWERIRAARRVVTAALEVQRRDKVIGASLEAAPLVQVADPELAAVLRTVPMDDICITSGLTVMEVSRRTTRSASTIRGIGVVFHAAEGEKCQRCWKILPDVGSHAHPGVCGRCDGALGLLSWLFWQMGSAPYLGGGFGHFYAYAPYPMEYPINRFAMETKRQLDVLNRHLEGRTWMVGDDITIADMAIAPWYGRTVMGQSYNAGEFLSVHEYTNVIAWAERFYARPAVQRGAG